MVETADIISTRWSGSRAARIAIVKRFRELARAAGTRVGEVLLDGAHLLQEALAIAASDRDRGRAERAAAHARRLPRSRNRRVARRSRRRRHRIRCSRAISPVDHPSGVVAIARAQPPTEALVDCMRAIRPGQTGRSCCAGAAAGSRATSARSSATAAACGATGVVAVDGSADPFGWKALRGAMGSTFHLPVAARQRLADVVARRARRTASRSSPPSRAAARRCRASTFAQPDRDRCSAAKAPACRPTRSLRADERVRFRCARRSSRSTSPSPPR